MPNAWHTKSKEDRRSLLFGEGGHGALFSWWEKIGIFIQVLGITSAWYSVAFRRPTTVQPKKCSNARPPPNRHTTSSVGPSSGRCGLRFCLGVDPWGRSSASPWAKAQLWAKRQLRRLAQLQPDVFFLQNRDHMPPSRIAQHPPLSRVGSGARANMAADGCSREPGFRTLARSERMRTSASQYSRIPLWGGEK